MDAATVDGSTRPPPDRFEADVVLADGGTVRVRPIVPADAELLAGFHARQSSESIYFRYFSPRPVLTDRDLERLTNVDYVDRLAFVGISAGEIVGVARYDRLPGRRDAEVAFFTDDAHIGRGIATVLLEYLAAAAREAGIGGFVAQVLPQNRKMLSVFKQAGFAVTSHFADGVIEVELGIEPTEEAVAAMEARAARSEAQSVARILEPRTVAVIGASRREGTLGHAVFRQLVAAGFEGPVFPVNPEAAHVGSVRAYASVLDVPDEVDLAVILVPAEQVPDVVEECARKGVRGLVVISAGFAEASPEGAEEEDRLVARVRGLGMRMVGPNTMGVINTAPGVRLHASFTDVVPRPGRVGVSSQSGTIGAAVLDELGRHGLGVSTFVAAGNKADVSGNDLLQYWELDDRTDVVLLYLESFGNPRNFARIARRVAVHTPIVAVKAGRLPPLDGRADEDPLAADVPVDALLDQTGVIRVDTLEQLVDAARVLASQPLPPGRRTVLLSNSWGPAILASNACLAAGLELPPLAPATAERLRAVLRPGARLENPLELTSEAGPAEYGAAMTALAEDPDVDVVLVLHAPTLPVRTAEIARAVGAAAGAGAGSGTTVVGSFLGPHEPGALDGLGAVPSFAFPESAALALGRICRYAAWRGQPSGVVPDLDRVDPVAARATAAAALGGAADDLVELDPVVACELLATHGIAPVQQRLVDGADGAVAAAREIGYPVALKATGLRRPAKTELGGLAVDVHGDDELRRSFERMAELHGDAMRPALVQAMARSGADLEVVVRQHPVYGSVLSLGPAGTGQLEQRIVPLTDVDAERLVSSVPDLGDEARWQVIDLALRLSALAVSVPELVEARLDPVLVSPSGAVPTDLHIRLRPWTRLSDPLVRRLA